MSDLRAEPLSPIDAATLWPQLGRLNTEVIATRGGENLLVSSGLAATGLTHLPHVPRTSVLGVRRGLGYRGVCVARELSGGAGWEVVSLRIVRPKDDETVVALCEGVAAQVAQRGSRTVFLRYAEGSPHADALRKGGFFAYRLEHLYAVQPTAVRSETPFRQATRADRHGIFRLYCRAVPEMVRRHEAPTQQDWRAVLDSFECTHGYVLDGPAGFSAWVGAGERENHILIDDPDDAVVQAALDLVELRSPRHGTLVVAEHQFPVESAAIARGYTAMGVRLMCARRLALMNTLKEVVAVTVEPMALPQ
ncbi:MAG: hypothetical protein IPF51_08670 [Dehalococcoidia bacterium]|uniref:hypothetical protein n=1 Tax=Candidatus Amarobacter glycogenicus TaxID=3140699 RepID=UPI003135C409|nr:hypothetical protein [Dehalococcoidia bacterium]MBK6563018.1 hypothetical protein [Dehalococcoidia bacterium]MBK8561638.1 hypothetical protein [Dehalococcoidia bacterium]MBK9546567.1 hypothetical protein [Dehalococcoidia bacterium]MCC6268893.1 hypothetical protein [Dehalococcoidia bacterium]